MELPCIYGLFDSEGNLRYIGKANDPAKRLASHMRDSVRRKTPVYDWIRKHGKPVMKVLAENCEDWVATEKSLIAEARARGDKLLNLADGGDQPFCPDEQRSQNGHKLVSLIRSDERFRRIWHIKRHLSAGIRKGEVSNKSRAKLRAAAEKRPDLFGVFAGIPDRQEDENGAPAGGYGKKLGGGYGAL